MSDIKMSEEKQLSTKKQNRIAKQNRRKHPEISKQIILLWEELRQKMVSGERKHELCAKIINISKSVIIELIRLKTTARVFESVIECGSIEHKWTVFEIIKSDLLGLCQGKYSHFAIISMLKYGTREQKLSVYEVMVGHIVQLLQDMFACKVVEAAYNDFANAQQRSKMIQEFYDKTFVLFNNDDQIKRLSDFTKNSNYDISILNTVHKVLIPILRKSKIDLTIVQQVIHEYLVALGEAKKQNPTESTVRQYQELLNEVVEIVHEQILQLCNTRFGAKLAMKIYYACSAKMRKKILQLMKEVIVSLCTSENAHLFVLAVLDQTDDTVQLRKNIVRPILGDCLDEILANIHGRKIVQFMLTGRDKRFMTTFVLKLLEQGDGNEHSKKDSVVRATEIVEMCSEPLLKWAEINVDDLLQYSDKIMMLLSVLEKCVPAKEDDLMTRYNAILDALIVHIDEPIISSNNGLKRKKESEKKQTIPKKKVKINFTGTFDNAEKTEELEPMDTDCSPRLIDTHLLESVTGNIIIKLLCKFEKEQKIAQFSTLCIEKISIDNIKSFIGCNRSAFFLVNLFETDNSAVQAFLRQHLASLETTMRQSQIPGVQVLCKLLF